MNAAEYLARVGFDYLATREALRESKYELGDEDDPARTLGFERAGELNLHEKVRQVLISPDWKPEPRSGALVGAKWLGLIISWPDRIADLKTWAGRSTLPQIITQRRASLHKKPTEIGSANLFDWTTIPGAEKKAKKAKKGESPEVKSESDPQPDSEKLEEGMGHSGIDSYPCQDARDIGFSPNATGIAVAYRPGLELLAIIGLQLLPLVSFGWRDVGFVHQNRVWRFPVEPRDGGYRYRWGEVKEYIQGAVEYNRATEIYDGVT